MIQDNEGRIYNRTRETPCDIYVLTDLAIPIPVDLVVSATALDPTPADLMLTAGGIAFETGAAAARAYPGLWRTESAAKSALQRAEKTDAFSNEFIKGRFAPHFCRVEFQLAGQGSRPKVASVDTRRIANPAEHLRQLFGELASFRVTEDPAAVEPAAAVQEKQDLAPPAWPRAPVTPDDDGETLAFWDDHAFFRPPAWAAWRTVAQPPAGRAG